MFRLTGEMHFRQPCRNFFPNGTQSVFFNVGLLKTFFIFRKEGFFLKNFSECMESSFDKQLEIVCQKAQTLLNNVKYDKKNGCCQKKFLPEKFPSGT